MKLSCTQENFAKGVLAVSRVVGTRGTLPILSHILLSTEKGRMKLAGTDLEIGIVSYVGAKIEQEGSVAVPARLLTEIITATSDSTINLSTDGQKIIIESERINTHLSGMDPDDFPLIPEVKSDSTITVDGTKLKEAIAQVVFATANDESRPILTGALIKIGGDSIVLAATDSYRLCEKTLKLKKPVGGQKAVVVPSRTLLEVGRLIGAGQDEITIILSENQISFDFSQIKVVSRILEGDFPDYEQIIPKEKSSSIEVKTQELGSALKLGMTFAREVSNNVRLLIGKESGVSLVATSPQVGDTTAKIGAVVGGEDLEIAFNAKFMLDILNVINSEKVILNFKGKHAPVLLRSGSDDNFRSLVMPLRLDES